MLTRIVKTITLAAAFTVVSAYAQIERTAIYKVPFAFTAGKQEFPAGTYVATTDHGRSLLRLRSEDNSSAVGSMVTLAKHVRAYPDRGQMVFYRYGSQVFLREVWVAGSDQGHQLPLTTREKELARYAGAPQVAKVFNWEPKW